jgi:hypothetical protein
MNRTLLLAALAAATACGSTPSASDAGASDAGTADAEAPTADMGVTLPDAGPECTTSADCAAPRPYCTPEGACAEPPIAGAIGWGDGSPGSVTLEKIFESSTRREATDLAFNNVRTSELWVLHRQPESSEPCTAASPSPRGCASLEGSVTIIHDPGTEAQRTVWRKDANAWHFMRRPPALAFGVDEFFATCGEARTGNYLDDRADFIGPTLWLSTPEWFGVPPPSPDMNGTHFDMLHGTPWCMGIAHERDNVYWLFNGNVGALDRYDFKDHHGPGAADHSDGELKRFAEGTLTRVPGVPGHLEYNAADQHVYVADTGGGRVIKLDTTSGVAAGTVRPVYEPLQSNVRMADAVVTDVVAPGLLERPSGLELRDGILYVSDNATSRIHAFDLEGKLLRTLDTGLPAGTLAGMAFSPSGVLHFVDLTNSDVYRVIPR